MELSQKTEFCQYLLYFSEKFWFSLITPYKELIWYTNYPDVQINTFHKHRSFIWECFFPVNKNKKACALVSSTSVLKIYEITTTVFSPQYNWLWPADQRLRFIYPENTREASENLFTDVIKREHYWPEMSKDNKNMAIKLR